MRIFSSLQLPSGHWVVAAGQGVVVVVRERGRMCDMCLLRLSNIHFCDDVTM